MNPQYTDEYLAKLYSSYQNSDLSHHRYKDDQIPRFAKHRDNFELIEKHGVKGRLLSVGSGNGIDLHVAKERGWHAIGYEVDKQFAEKLAEKTNAQIFNGDFTQLSFKELFDCVYLNHVIEHPKNPREYLNKISHSLKIGGLLYLATPNIQSISIKVKRLLDTINIRGKEASYYDTWQHLTYFNPRQLIDVLTNQYGLETVHVSADCKKIKNGKVIHSLLDKLTLTSSFRLLAKKIRDV